MELIKFTEETRNMYDERFGMFVHWGLYSQLAGVWKEHKRLLRPKKGDGSWIMLVDEIPLAEYSQAAYDFKPDLDWAEKLAATAKKIGVKYLVFTAKHHDGFSMFATKATTYNSMDMCGRDFVAELAEACKHHGLKLGLYYSHCLDWAEEGGGGAHFISRDDTVTDAAEHNNYWDFPGELTKEAFAEYLEQKAKVQVEELLTNYGDIYIIWYDFPHDITVEQSKEMYDLVKAFQPKCLVNSRVGHCFGDYSSLGDNMIPTTPTNNPTECLVTLNDTWGYLWYDDNWKSPEYTTELLARCIAGETTLLMNVSPMPDGGLPEATEDILAFMGNWTTKYADAVYSMNPNPFKTMVDWGHIACKDNRIYVYVSDTTRREYIIGGFEAKVSRITAPDGAELAFTQNGDEVSFCFEDKYGFLPVVVLECDREIVPVKSITQCGDQLNLFPIWAQKHCADGQLGQVPFEYCLYDPNLKKYGLALNRACIIHEWKDEEEWLQWEAVVKRAGTYSIKLVTALSDYDGGAVVEVYKDGVTVSSIETKQLTEESRYDLSKTNQANVRIVSSVGKIEIEAPGTYTISLKKTTVEKGLPVSHLSLEVVG